MVKSEHMGRPFLLLLLFWLRNEVTRTYSMSLSLPALEFTGNLEGVCLVVINIFCCRGTSPVLHCSTPCDRPQHSSSVLQYDEVTCEWLLHYNHINCCWIMESARCDGFLSVFNSIILIKLFVPAEGNWVATKSCSRLNCLPTYCGDILYIFLLFQLTKTKTKMHFSLA